MKHRRRNRETQPADDFSPPIIWITSAEWRIIRIALDDRIQLMTIRELYPAALAAQKVADKITTLIEQASQ